MVRVVECLGKQFDETCSSLIKLIDQRLAPDLIIGIESGGGEILRNIVASNPGKHAHCYVRAARNGTKLKTGLKIGAALRRLPRVINDALRIAEHIYREFRFQLQPKITPRNVEIADADVEKIKAAKAICLVDDAVDTGSSISQIKKLIAELNPNAIVTVASVVQTFRQPIVVPDLTLYSRVLVRFPWSEDAK
jgi:hypoxanthine phosphoribosyltransferase